MAGNEYNLVTPKRFPQDPLRIVAGSPLAVQGVFLEILRERFNEKAGLYFVWREDLTLTDIIIETSYNEHVEARNKAPALYVYRLSTVPSKQVLGDRAGVSLPNHLEGHGALNTVALMIECLSNDEGESGILADIVQYTLLAGRDVILREFGFYDLSHPTLGQTTPFQRDQTKWTTPVEFMVQYWVRWEQVPIKPLLQQIAHRIVLDGETADQHFLDATLNSLRRATNPQPTVPLPDEENLVFDKNGDPLRGPLPRNQELFLSDQSLLGTADGVNTIFKTHIPFMVTETAREAIRMNNNPLMPGEKADYLVAKSDPEMIGYDTIVMRVPPQIHDVLTIDFYLITAATNS